MYSCSTEFLKLTICTKMDLALNNLQGLICYKTQLTHQPTKDFVSWKCFLNGSGNRCSIPGPVIPKTQKMVLEAAYLTLSIKRYGYKVKWPYQEEGVAPSRGNWVIAN